MKKQTKNYDCKQCESGIVIVETKETKSDVSIDVKKCSKCKHQYGLKEFWQAYGRELQQQS
jgi:hypothetical protein